MKIFLRYEIDLYTNYLGKPIAYFLSVAANVALCQEDITVNEVRAAFGVPPHPDDRGNVYIHVANENRAGDDKIPDQVLATYKQDIIDKNATVTEGKLTDEELRAKFPKLFK